MDVASAILGALGILVPAGSGWLVLRARQRHEKVTETQAQVQNDIEFRTYVDGVVQQRVEDAVAAATAPLLAKIDDQQRQIVALRERADATAKRDGIFARFVQRLYWWDEGNRPGPMPRLTHAEQQQLDLNLLPAIEKSESAPDPAEVENMG